MSLYDRQYMREQPNQPSALKPLYWLLGSIVGVFIVQILVKNLAGLEAYHSFLALFSLSSYGVEHGYIWNFLTYSFLHSTDGAFFLLHILFNGVMIFWLGRVLIQLLGNTRFFTLYGLAVLLGGIAWFLIISWKVPSANMVGASGGVMGLFLVFAKHLPNQPIRVLLFLVIPFNTTPRDLLRIILIFELVGFVINDLAIFGSPFLPIAHSAHLGGMLGGWVFVKYILNKDFSFSGPDIKPPKWFTSKKTSKAQSGRFRINFTNRGELQKEVDRILDKINKEGFGSLTEKERETLDKAKELLNK